MIILLVKRKILLIWPAILAALFLQGCSRRAAPPGDVDKIRPDSLVIGTASMGGTYYLYGQGWASLLEQSLGIPVAVEETGGPIHNIILVEHGYLKLGMTTMGPAYEAWFGREDWTGGRQHRNIRALFPMYNTYFHWLADAGSGITGLSDLAGKRVGSGPAGGTMGVAGPRIYDLLGLDVQVTHGSIRDLVNMQAEGLLDANGFAAGIPVPAFRDYERTKGPRNVIFFGIDGEDREKVKARWPYLTDAVIPAGTYQALDRDLPTIGVWNVAIAHKDLDDDLVYQIVRTVLENNPAMVQAHEAARETVAENIREMYIIPLHPGALRYYLEQGLEVPDHLLPPEQEGT